MNCTIELTFENLSMADKFVITASVDQSKVTTRVPNGLTKISLDFNDEVDEHCVCIDITGKTFEDTELDLNGNIVQDLLISLVQVKVDDIETTDHFYRSAEYIHDANGSAELTSHDFFGPIGCNGRLILNFTSPFYIWYLKNL